MAVSSEFGLPRLLHRDSANEFLDTCWPEKPCVVHGPLQRLAGLADVPEFASAYELIATPSKVVRVDFGAPEFEYPTAVYPTSEQAYRLYMCGFTVYKAQIEPRTESVRAWLGAIEQELGLPPGTMQLNAFLSRISQGIRPHWDAQENFLVQLRGRKKWKIARNEQVRFPSVNHMIHQEKSTLLGYQCAEPLPARMPDHAETVLLEPGSVLFLPRGYWHTTETIDDSIHLLLQARIPTWADLLMDLLQRGPLLHELAWRSPALGAWKDGAVADGTLDQLLEKIRSLGHALDASTLAELQRLLEASRPGPAFRWTLAR